jgi:diguanylate cyclase (GGDEF)-like protein
MTSEMRGSFLIYLIGEETAELSALRVALTQSGFEILNFKKIESALEKVTLNPPHIAIVDLEAQNMNAQQYMENFLNSSPETLHIAALGGNRQMHSGHLLELGFYDVIDRSQRDGRSAIAVLDRALERIYYQYQAEQISEESAQKIAVLENQVQEQEAQIIVLEEKKSGSDKQSEELFQKIRSYQIKIGQLEAELEASEGKTQRYIADFVKLKNEKDVLESAAKKFKGEMGGASFGFTGLMNSLAKCHSVEDAIQDWLNKTHKLYQDTATVFFRYIPNHSHLVLSQCAGLDLQKVRGIGVPLAGLSLKEQKYFYSHVRFLANLRDLIKGAFNVSEFEFRELVTDKAVVGLCVIFKGLKNETEKRFFNDSIELLNLVASRNALAFKVHEYDFKDELTQLPTKKSIDDALAAEISRSGRTQLPLSALYVRIDGFAEHETKWEAESEKIVKAVSTILRKTSRINDLIFRTEKDQFVTLCPHTPLQGAKIKAENLCKLVSKAQIRTVHGELIPKVTISVGISEYPALSRDSEGLLISADEALFEASKRGGNRAIPATNIDDIETIEQQL